MGVLQLSVYNHVPLYGLIHLNMNISAVNKVYRFNMLRQFYF
jgi:hypothetical protein